MMKRFNLRSSNKALLSAGLLSLALVGCGSDGEDGQNGVIGVNIDSTSTLKANFTHAEINNGQVTVNFTLENANGVAVLGLNNNHDLRFGIAQLTHIIETTTDGKFAGEYDRGFQWQSYINAEKQPVTDDLPSGDPDINPTAQFQAELEVAKNCETCLIDNQDGSYQYSFTTNVTNINEPVAVNYNGNFTHRATLELQLPKVVINAHFDWQPSTGKTEDIQTRSVVAIETCYTCHQPDSLELHGGRRLNIENCASCHTATSGDPESGNSIDFTYMIHAIHKGKDRVTVNSDKETVAAPYKVIGYKGSIHNYGKVMYPQHPAADCQACHVEGDNAPENAALFKADLSSSACIGCHTEKPSSNHSDTNCVACHNADNTYPGTGNAEKRHGDVLKGFNLSQNYSVSITNIAPNGTGLKFDVQVLNEQGEPVAKEYIYSKGYTAPNIIVSWDIDKDYPAYETGSKYSERAISLYSDQAVYNAATKTFAITSSAIQLPNDPNDPNNDINGKTFELLPTISTCFTKGGYGVTEITATSCYDTDGNLKTNVNHMYIQNTPLRFIWNNGVTEDAVTERRSIIDAAKCSGCHNQEIYHYDNGVNCQSCHTSDKGLSYGNPKKPTSFAHKAHLASGHYLKYAGVESQTVIKTDCATCHVDTSKEQGIKLGRAPHRVWRFADTNTGADLWVSSDAGSCLTCHQKYLSESGKSHIESFGGIINGTDKQDVLSRTSESCATCHNPEQIKSIHKK